MNAQKKLITVRTISFKHVAQLPYEHYWDGEFDFAAVEIIGRIATDGFILCRDKKTGQLRKVSPIAYYDWQLEKLGCRRRVNSKWEYAPTPHNKFTSKAIELCQALPQIFTDEVVL